MTDFDVTLSMILEGALLASPKPLTIEHMQLLFSENSRPDSEAIKQALTVISEQCEGRGFELKEVASGYRFQVRSQLSEWVGKLWEERPPRYTRALLETLALIAYRQPITRGEIEDIRGVSVSSSIIKTLQEREWVRVVGHRDVPGRPAMYATTRQFLDYFNLQSLDQLPPLAEIKEMAANEELALDESGEQQVGSSEESQDKPMSADELFAELDDMEQHLPEHFDQLLSGKFEPEADEEEAASEDTTESIDQDKSLHEASLSVIEVEETEKVTLAEETARAQERVAAFLDKQLQEEHVQHGTEETDSSESEVISDERTLDESSSQQDGSAS
ncbi:SMC-Scp complex subunit ScpB [Zooshikella harenae]|uniref:SMC-Scp complex subunit ScpB n=1 Tax=Zooshikella harenae TaxID=2827238 RepID=A0ABS5Z8H2_9GAMM|nr:SMC-Scp complex subunit ScpB [Zooshikella harenae]MBU2710345.1 SMC-Scp complex subunit ScpB [Zooshikella harenae]